MNKKYSEKRNKLVNRYDTTGSIYTTLGPNPVSVNPELVDLTKILGSENLIGTPLFKQENPTISSLTSTGKKGSAFFNNLKNFTSNAINDSGFMTAVGGVANNLLSNGLSTGVGSAMNTIGAGVAQLDPVAGAAIMGASGIFNAAFGSKLNKEKILEIEKGNKELLNLQVDQSSSKSIMDQFSDTTFGQAFSKKDIGKDGFASNKAKNTYKRLQAQQANAINSALSNFSNAADNLEQNQIADTLANFAAYGGPINMRYTGVMSPFGNRFDEGGSIYIKPSKKGTFTAAAKKHGKSVQEFAAQVLANKDNYSSAMVKKANFARNAAKWHSDGGPLFTHGAIWSNGTTMINNGGTHEENPLEGVQIGIDNEGIPNLVEEGEVIFNDYVYSNRMKASKILKKKLKLTGDTFADLAKSAQKESKERPNDPISIRGLQDTMAKLAEAQEELRGKKEMRKNNEYAEGGLLGNLYKGTGNKSNKLKKFNSQLLATPSFSNGQLPSVNELSNVLSNTLFKDYTKENLNSKIKNVQPLTEKMVRSKNPYYDRHKYFGIEDPNRNLLSKLRYVPAIGSFLGAMQGMLDKPDYSTADTLFDYAKDAGNYKPVSAERIGNYLPYKPFDRDYYSTKVASQAASQRRALTEKSAGNRAAALSSILASDYNTMTKLGDLYRAGDEYNFDNLLKVNTYNRDTNKFNAEMGLKAAMANQDAYAKAKSAGLSGITQAMSMRDSIDARRGASISANLTNLFDSLGNIGIDTYNREDRDKLIRAGIFGTLNEKPQEWSQEKWNDYKRATSSKVYKNGGKLKKKRGGFTY